MNDADIARQYGAQNADKIRQALMSATGTARPQGPADLACLPLPADAPAPELVLTPPEDEKAARKVRHREAAEQIEYMDRVRRCLHPETGRARPDRPRADMIFALANENAAGRGVGVLRWKMGVRAGLCDIGIFAPRQGFHGAFIEMKQSSGVASDVRPAQRACLEALCEAGYKAVVCYGWHDAWKFTVDYLGWDVT